MLARQWQRNGRTLSAVVCALGLSVALPPGAIGKQEVQDSHSSHDLTGLYDLVGGMGGHQPPASELGELQEISPNLGAVTTAHLVPWARAKMAASADYAVIDDSGAVCQPDGLFRQPLAVAGWMVLQAPGKVFLVSTTLPEVGVRRIYLTDKHPKNLRATWTGHSIGHWDGDTLVVDTIGFNDKSWLGTELQPHTEELHLVERIRTVKNGRLLEIQTTVDDRKALTAPYIFSRYYLRSDTSFEDLVLPCNSKPGDQQMWNYLRHQAVEQFESNRKAVP